MTSPKAMFVLGAALFAFMVFMLIDGGQMPRLRGDGITREKNPVMYWAAVAAYSAGAIGFLLAAFST